ncbi:MAG: tetratricopeptide repeat protein [Phycisphaerales bacterium]|nr:tetratricopeptide repeat protein [Phycisphaerales bacterium]
MKLRSAFRPVLAIGAIAACLAIPARADGLRNVKVGEEVPAYRLPTIDGVLADSEASKGSVVVLVYLSAEQTSSEIAASESAATIKPYEADGVQLLHVTADVVHKPYFERFRQDRNLTTALAFDAERTLYGKLGLIVFPTTIVIDREGKLAHVISARGLDYAHTLDCYVRHTLGRLTDAQLAEALKTRPSTDSSPKSLASRHRAAARLLREKGLLDASRNELDKAREQDPADVEIALDLADLDIASDQLDEAETLVGTVLASQPEHRRAKQLQGVLLYRRNDLVGAEAVLLEALDLNPDPARVHYYLGRIYEQQGAPEKALEHYREALRHFLKEPDLK